MTSGTSTDRAASTHTASESIPQGLLAGRVAVVTGGARGLGYATVEALAEEGALPVILDHDAQQLAKASSGLKSRNIDHLALQLDVTDERAVNNVFAAVGAWRKRIDILVNNAGTALRKPTIDLSAEEWRTVVEVNMTGVFLCSQSAARFMLPAKRGVIVNVSSIMGLSGGGIYPNISYQSTKGALINLTRALAVEWAADGIRVNAVAPTWVRTALTEGLISNPETLRRMLDLTPMRRLAEPRDVAEAVVFLASDKSAMITGHTLPIDGGYLAQ